MIFLMMLLSIPLNAADIYCSNGGCAAQDANSSIVFSNGNATKTVIWVNTLLDSVLTISVPAQTIPRNANIYIQNQDRNKDLTIHSGSTIPNTPGGDVNVYSDIFNILAIDSSGLSGTNGKHSSEICAANMQSGLLGTAAQTYWNSRQAPLSPTSCAATDETWIDSQFSCPVGYTYQATDSVTVKRIERKNKCASNYFKNRCVKRTYDLVCRFDITRRVADNTSYELKDHYSYYIPPMPNGGFNIARYSYIGSGYYNSGRYFDITYKVTDKQLASFPTPKTLCADLFTNQVKFTAYFNLLAAPGVVPAVTHVNSTTASLDTNTGIFQIPLPDSGTDSRGGTLDYTNTRIIIKSMNSLGFYVDNLARDDVSYGPRTRREFTHCLGMGGSLATSPVCTKIPGPAYSFTYNIVDQYGAISQDLVLNVPASNSRTLYLYMYSNTPYQAVWDGGAAYSYRYQTNTSTCNTGSRGNSTLAQRCVCTSGTLTVNAFKFNGTYYDTCSVHGYWSYQPVTTVTDVDHGWMWDQNSEPGEHYKISQLTEYY
jgi:hypothetical protein